MNKIIKKAIFINNSNPFFVFVRNKETILLIIILFFLMKSSSLKSQTYSELNAKERYDDIYIGAFDYPPNIESFGNLDNGYVLTRDQNYNLVQHGSTLESLLTMYKTTKDKAYLYKFMEWSFRICEFRDFSHSFINSDSCYEINEDGEKVFTTSCLNFNARLLWPMAHFAYIVKNEEQNVLYNEPINNFSSYGYNSNIYGSFTTFGAFADWLYLEVKQRLDWFTGIDPSSTGVLWIDPDRGFRHSFESDLSNGSGAAELNFQAPWGLTLIYMYLIGGNNGDDYGIKALQLAELYFENLYLYRDLNCNDELSTSECFSIPVLRYKPNSSYWWYHAGWSLNINYHIACLTNNPYRGKCSHYTEFKEDIGHGIWDIMFPLLYNKYANFFNPHLTSGNYFENYQMVRFRNTFTKNIWDSNYGGFHMAVDGTDGNISASFCNNVFNSETCRDNALAWMPLYKFDITGETENVYSIIMDYYRDELQNKTSSTVETNFAPMKYKGLSDIVAAQWDKECPYTNLILKKRDVVYDQDFFAQNNLIIDPKVPNEFYTGNDESFADPVITEEKFIIESNVNVNLTAGNSIELLPGFETKAGCDFNASIDPSICTSSKSLLTYNNGGENHFTKPENNYEADTIKNKKEEQPFIHENTLTVIPNPFSDNTNIQISLQKTSNISLAIYDCFGRPVFNNISKKYVEKGIYNIPFSGSNLCSGIYYCVLLIDGNTKLTKNIFKK